MVMLFMSRQESQGIMKLNIKKLKKNYRITCFCGCKIYVDTVPDWYTCPECGKTISIFKRETE